MFGYEVSLLKHGLMNLHNRAACKEKLDNDVSFLAIAVEAAFFSKYLVLCQQMP